MADVALVRENEIVFACGKKASGKSTLLYEYFVTANDRTISLDFVGEVKERNPNAVQCVGFDGVLATLRELTSARVMRWHIAAVFDEYTTHELPKLFRLLCPPFNPGRQSLSRTLGGLALECSECDVILPNGNATVEAKNMIKRGRHELLSLYLGTQRPQECSRLCTSQADYIISFRMHEPNEMRYLARTVSNEYAEVVKRLPKYSSAWYCPAVGEVQVRDGDGNVTQSFFLGARSQLDL
jgi:hypothetical protein